jgi:PAS domain S-box-containing protein
VEAVAPVSGPAELDDLARVFNRMAEEVRTREAALRATEEKFSRTFRATPVGISLVSLRDGRHVEVNDGLLQILGYTREEMIGRTAAELGTWKHPADRERIIEELQRTGGVRGREVDLVRKSGDAFAAFVGLDKVEIGGESMLVGTVLEITERKQAEEALRQSETRYRMLHESLRDAFVQVAMDGRIVDCNEVYCQMLGYTRDEVHTLTYRDLTPERWHAFEDYIVQEQIIARGYSDVYEKEYRRKDGTVFPVELRTILARDGEGRPCAMWGIVRDITERKQAEERLRATLAEKEAALATNQALLREVHHRVKNNLQMLCDLMYLQMEAMPEPDQHQDLQDAYSRIYAIARLHEQLYRSMQSGHVAVGEYLRRLAGGFEDLFSRVSVKVDAEGSDVSLDLDRAIHVGLIVNELITNAAKHAFPKGQPGDVLVRLRSVGDEVHLQVRDNGQGLPADLDLEQAKTIGLRTVYLLARRLEAKVDIDRNGGTGFTLTFPLHAEPPRGPAVESA